MTRRIVDSKQRIKAGFLIFALAVLYLFFTNISALAGTLSLPFDTDYIRSKFGADTGSFTCKSPPLPMQDLQFQTVYSDINNNASVIDEKANRIYQAATQPLRQFEYGLASMANRYLQSNPPRPEIARCVQDWLWSWASAGALMGDVNHTGEFVRKWVLASIAAAWLQVKDEPTLDADKRREVRRWMKRTARVVKEDYSRDLRLPSRRNNHLYWAGWSVAATAVALNDRDLFDWAISQARLGIHEIDKHGILPLEMARGSKALDYHSYAAIPLFLLAEAGMKNGIDLYSDQDGALLRLGKNILRGLDDPSVFEKASGYKQDHKNGTYGGNLVWLEIYHARTGDKSAKKWLKILRPLRYSRAGGNVTLLYGP